MTPLKIWFYGGHLYNIFLKNEELDHFQKSSNFLSILNKALNGKTARNRS